MSKEIDCSNDFVYNNETNQSLVQIRISRQEMNRRISAFIERKRREVNEWNNQEFFNQFASGLPAVESCARVDVCSVPRHCGRSRFKVSRVENLWGPQTRARLKNSSLCKNAHAEDPALPQSTAVDQAIEERLRNMESHLKLKSSGLSKTTDVYRRLKELENRILYLEGISPEYFESVRKSVAVQENRSSRWSELEKKYKNYSNDDIDMRLAELEEVLQNKKT